MRLTRYASVDGQIVGDRFEVLAEAIYKAEHGDSEIFKLGAGSKEELDIHAGGWVIRHDGMWWLRHPGNGQRGQCLIRGGCWSTRIYAPTPEQAEVLSKAEITLPRSHSPFYTLEPKSGGAN